MERSWDDQDGVEKLEPDQGLGLVELVNGMMNREEGDLIFCSMRLNSIWEKSQAGRRVKEILAVNDEM